MCEKVTLSQSQVTQIIITIRNKCFKQYIVHQ